MVKLVLRAWWILSLAAAVALLGRGLGEEGRDLHLVLAGLALLNTTLAFVGTAVVGRLNLLLGAHGIDPARPGEARRPGRPGG